MPREAKLFAASAGSGVRGFLKFRANIPPRWIGNARTSRKRVEPEIAAAFQSFMRLTKNRPRARAAIRNAQKELRVVLKRWEIAYHKENFYRGIRVLLELQRNGSSNLWAAGRRRWVARSGGSLGRNPCCHPRHHSHWHHSAVHAE
jgi:hypothetical protein